MPHRWLSQKRSNPPVRASTHWHRLDCDGQCAQTLSENHHPTANANGPSNHRFQACSVIPRSPWQTALRGSLEVFDLAQPAGQWVPSGPNLGHHPSLALRASFGSAGQRVSDRRRMSRRVAETAFLVKPSRTSTKSPGARAASVTVAVFVRLGSVAYRARRRRHGRPVGPGRDDVRGAVPTGRSSGHNPFARVRSSNRPPVPARTLSLSICRRTCDSGQDCDPQRFAVGAAIRRSSSKKLKMTTSRSCGRSNEPSSGATATRSPSGCRSNERCPVCGPM